MPNFNVNIPDRDKNLILQFGTFYQNAKFIYFRKDKRQIDMTELLSLY